MRSRLTPVCWTYSAVLLMLLAVLFRPTARAAEDLALSEAVLEVVVNEQASGDMLVVLRDDSGQVWLQADDFERLRIQRPDALAHLHEHRPYLPLQALRGAQVFVDESRQLLKLTLPSSAFATTRLSAAERAAPAITPASPGAFVNYQLSAQRIEAQNTAGAFAELGLFSAPGVLTTTVVARAAAGTQSVMRLDSTFTRDFPARMQTLNVGDAISDGGSWGNAVRFGGLRFSRNFNLRPDLLTVPLLSAGGAAAVPSTVDVFVNNQLVNTQQVQPGPFIIDRLPAVTGQGDVRVVVRDALGREQVMTQAFYSSTTLLARGLSEYALDVGSLRHDYALASDHYGSLLLAATYRRGLSSAFTLEGHGEALDHGARALGLNGAMRVGDFGILSATLAAGGAPGSSGTLMGGGFEHRARALSLVASSTWSSSGYRQVADMSSAWQRYRRRSLLQASVSLGPAGSLALAYVEQTFSSGPSQQTLSLTHSLSLRRLGTLNFTVSHVHAVSRSTGAFLIYTLPLDGRRAVTATGVGGRGEGAPVNEVIGAVMQNAPVGPGSGYRLSASSGANYDAAWRQQFNAAELEVEGARNAGVNGQSAYFSGGATILDGQVSATRSVSGSFAMVEVGGLPDVPVYVENQLVTHTDAAGRALLYHLRPYELNHIGVDPEDLPLDTTIEARMTLLVPPYRSGVIARFPVERTRGGTFRLRQDDGSAVPIGASVSFRGRVFPVVMDGMVYVTGIDHALAGQASWAHGNRCQFRLEPSPASDPLPDLGEVACHGIDTGESLPGQRAP